MLKKTSYFSNFTIFKKNYYKFIVIVFNKYFFFKYSLKNNLDLYKLLGFYSLSYKIFFCKISYIGKSYRVLNNKSYLTLNMNRAHITFLFFKKKIILLNFVKTKFLFKVFNKKTLLRLIYYINKARSLNIFTHRGFMIKKTFILKKKGKVSSYR